MNPLRFQSIGLAAISMPFALRGFIATDMAAWATAFTALLGASAGVVVRSGVPAVVIG
jgi:hypothetical protein